MLEAISKHGRNWKAIVKAYFPRRTSLSAKNRYYLRIFGFQRPIQNLELILKNVFPERYSLLIRKMEPRCKQSQSSATKKASTKSLPKSLPRRKPLTPDRPPASQFQEEPVKVEEDRPLYFSVSTAESLPGSLSVPFGPQCRPYNTTNLNNQEHYTFESPSISHEAPDENSYTPASSECPPLSPADWSGLTPANIANSEASFPITTPPGSHEDMSLFCNDLQLDSHFSQGDMVSFANAKYNERITPNIGEINSQAPGITFRHSGGRVDMNSNMVGNTSSRIVTVLINSEIPETVNSIVNQIGREEGVSIAIHLE